MIAALTRSNHGLGFLEQTSKYSIALFGDVGIPVAHKERIVHSSGRCSLLDVFGIMETAVRVGGSCHSDGNLARLDGEQLKTGDWAGDSACCIDSAGESCIGDDQACVAIVAFPQPNNLVAMAGPSGLADLGILTDDDDLAVDEV